MSLKAELSFGSHFGLNFDPLKEPPITLFMRSHCRSFRRALWSCDFELPTDRFVI